MYDHYIILSSCYAEGCRIVLDTTRQDEFLKNKNRLLKRFGGILPISIHIIPTNGIDFDSVIQVDHYFDDVRVIKSYNEFVGLVALDRKLSGLDVALYILAKEQCSHFKLEKLTYLCYADYLCKYEKPMFVDKIYAYQYGPIVKGVLKKFGKKYDAADDKTTKSIASKTLKENFMKSRILNADDGIKILYSIDDTLKKYGKESTNRLIQMTHKENSPWDRAGRGLKKNRRITDTMILKYHCNEEL